MGTGTLLRSWRRRQQATQDDHLPTWTQPSDWKPTSPLRECRLRLPADECYVVTHQSHLLSDRATRQREPLRVLLHLRSRDQCHGAVALVGSRCLRLSLRCLATLSYRDRVTPHG